MLRWSLCRAMEDGEEERPDEGRGTAQWPKKRGWVLKRGSSRWMENGTHHGDGFWTQNDKTCCEKRRTEFLPFRPLAQQASKGRIFFRCLPTPDGTTRLSFRSGERWDLAHFVVTVFLNSKMHLCPYFKISEVRIGHNIPVKGDFQRNKL